MVKAEEETGKAEEEMDPGAKRQKTSTTASTSATLVSSASAPSLAITKVVISIVGIPLAKPYTTAMGTTTHGENVIVQVHTSTGIVGLGEADPLEGFTKDTPASILMWLHQTGCPALIGENPLNINAITLLLDDLDTAQEMAKGAINMALYDIVGKALGVPVHCLLGGAVRDRVDIAWPLSDQTAAQDLVEIEQKRSEGYSTFMLKMGSKKISIAEEITRVKTISSRFGSTVRVHVDANQGWDLDEASEFVTGVAGVQLDWVEQPLSKDDYKGLAELRGRTTYKLCADESCQTVQDAVQLCRNNEFDFFALKISKCGGISRAVRVAQVAANSGKNVQCNSMLEFGITQAALLHVTASLDNLVPGGHFFHSCLRFADQITDFKSYLSNGIATVPTSPGLGITLDQCKLEKYQTRVVEV